MAFDPIPSYTGIARIVLTTNDLGGTGVGGPLTDTDVIAEVERYIAIPSQALAYKIGQLKIRELRNRAEEALGDKFDVRAYHDLVLTNGSLPLFVLEAEVDRWIERQKG